MNIIWDPREIEKKSMEIIEGYLTGLHFSEAEKAIAKRVIHTTGDPDIIEALRFHPAAVAAGMKALRSGQSVFADVNMLKSGVNASRLKGYGGQVICSISEPEIIQAAKEWKITRAAAAMRSFGPRLDQAVVAIGNAPTALFELLNLISQGKCRPALIIGTPVGFVGAAEAKEELIAQDWVPFISLLGTRGGSPIAVSIVNAMLYFEGEDSRG
ncbi:MAG TPA: precorrin-8X methylmutase [Syntrophomonadaceae bacterium]|nr:precorrin-8X methylmutase [Syntrophomonadaceae bacterium]